MQQEIVYTNIVPEQTLNVRLPANTYQEKWEARSSIRTRPRKLIDFNQTGIFFPESKQPILLSKDVAALGPELREAILLHSFYKYLNDIINLEIEIICSACNNLIYKDLAIKYPEEMKLNAYTIIIDEYYHVYTAKDMLFQLNRRHPYMHEFNYPISDSYYAVTETKDQLSKKYHDIFEIIAVCLFETTLVRELIEFFNSETIHPSIKYYINDHMNDEAKHYGFFYDLLCYTWANLPEDYKKNIGLRLADFIKLYLNINSEKTFNLELLEHFIQDKEKAGVIIEGLYKGFDITPEIPIVKNVVSVLQKSGLLQDVYVKSGFLAIGWDL